MELLETTYCFEHGLKPLTLQIPLDEEVFVPEGKPEIWKILFKKGEAYQEPAVGNGKSLRIKGRMEYWIWYLSAAEGKHSCITGAIPFEEEVDLPEEGWKGEISLEVEDFSVSILHPRKLRINGLVGVTIRLNKEENPKICYEVSGVKGAQQKKKTCKALQFLGEKTETLRIRQNMEIPSSSENLEELLFSHIALRSPDFLPMDGKVKVQGDLDVCCVCRSEEEENPVFCLSRMIPFQGELNFSESRSGGILLAVPKLIHREVSIAQDADGENRLLAVDGVLEVHMKMWEEVMVPVLSDVYSPEVEVTVERECICLPKLCVKNQARMKLADTVSLPANERVLQVCGCDGWVKVDSVEEKPEGLLAEGVLFYWGLYASAGNGDGFANFAGAAPFSFVIDMGKKEDACGCTCYQVIPRLEQLNMSLIGNSEMECRAAILFDAMIWKEEKENVIVKGAEAPIDPEVLNHMSGIIGYIVQPQDSLWDIAKKYYTTEDLIRRKNGVTGEVKPGDRLVLLRSSGGILK